MRARRTIFLLVRQLEVLDGGPRHAAVEVENVGAHLVVPLGRLILEDDDIGVVLEDLVPLEHTLLGGRRLEHLALPLGVDAGHHHLHLARAAGAEDVLLVEHGAQLLPRLDERAVLLRLVQLLGVGALVVQHELRAYEVGAQLAEEVAALPREVVLVERDEVVGRLVLLALARGEEELVAVLEVDLIGREEAAEAGLPPLDVALHHRALRPRPATAREQWARAVGESRGREQRARAESGRGVACSLQCCGAAVLGPSPSLRADGGGSVAETAAAAAADSPAAAAAAAAAAGTPAAGTTAAAYPAAAYSAAEAARTPVALPPTPSRALAPPEAAHARRARASETARPPGGAELGGAELGGAGLGGAVAARTCW
eukprot:scaffold15072_cov68-Phaeocystis_antarctica.AAC.8